MERTVVKGNFDINHRVTSDDTLFERFTHPFFCWSDKFLRNCPADDFIDKLEAQALFLWFDIDNDMTILASTTGLADILTFDVLSWLLNRLPIGYLRTANVGFNVELTLH